MWQVAQIAPHLNPKVRDTRLKLISMVDRHIFMWYFVKKCYLCLKNYVYIGTNFTTSKMKRLRQRQVPFLVWEGCWGAKSFEEAQCFHRLTESPVVLEFLHYEPLLTYRNDHLCILNCLEFLSVSQVQSTYCKLNITACHQFGNLVKLQVITI